MSYIPGFSRRITLDLPSSISGSNHMDPQTNQEWGRSAITMADGEPPDPDVAADVTAVEDSDVGLLGGTGSSSTTAI
tara:strand:- start:552 stop:782 length:231 start_codon:yes stop_codon:yes gene_type:complete